MEGPRRCTPIDFLGLLHPRGDSDAMRLGVAFAIDPARSELCWTEFIFHIRLLIFQLINFLNGTLVAISMLYIFGISPNCDPAPWGLAPGLRLAAGGG